MGYKRKTKEELQQEVKILMGQMDTAIQDYAADPAKVKELLQFMSTFYKYSAKNQFLIQSQYPGATCVASYKQFKDRGFHVQKGEMGIRIYRPNMLTLFQVPGQEWKPMSQATVAEKKQILRKEFKTKTVQHFKLTSVFDISQTNAKPEDVPDLLPNKPEKFDTVENIEIINKALREISEEEGIFVYSYEEAAQLNLKLGASKGAHIQTENGTELIVVRADPSTTEYTHTLIHELAHAHMHHGIKQDHLTTAEKEYQAEMAAYVVSEHLGIDTWDFSEAYIANWTKNGTHLENAQLLLKEVGEFGHQFIPKLEEQRESILERIEEQDKERSR
ncbi:ArdC-like ssDNA-binding domain-containing protein [Listeria goaensis]|uniref:ArdC-like ssDNA-binding domain-containing protein n=1 Tax=Listeria goaensis TaxID=1649188 RepID=UPI000B596AC7|nr:ArdC-like ssDNA-binding domain-containing protein [Listeria goaensis]